MENENSKMYAVERQLIFEHPEFFKGKHYNENEYVIMKNIKTLSIKESRA